jgi:hypothetical protein
MYVGEPVDLKQIDLANVMKQNCWPDLHFIGISGVQRLRHRVNFVSSYCKRTTFPQELTIIDQLTGLGIGVSRDRQPTTKDAF